MTHFLSVILWIPEIPQSSQALFLALFLKSGETRYAAVWNGARLDPTLQILLDSALNFRAITSEEEENLV